MLISQLAAELTTAGLAAGNSSWRSSRRTTNG
jgi:hypothetical protein